MKRLENLLFFNNTKAEKKFLINELKISNVSAIIEKKIRKENIARNNPFLKNYALYNVDKCNKRLFHSCY